MWRCAGGLRAAALKNEDRKFCLLLGNQRGFHKSSASSFELYRQVIGHSSRSREDFKPRPVKVRYSAENLWYNSWCVLHHRSKDRCQVIQPYKFMENQSCSIFSSGLNLANRGAEVNMSAYQFVCGINTSTFCGPAWKNKEKNRRHRVYLESLYLKENNVFLM